MASEPNNTEVKNGTSNVVGALTENGYQEIIPSKVLLAT